MTNLPKLPTGIQTFEEIRTDGYLYVDKTNYLVDLIDRGKVYFLSRPRRFGKSVTISTLDALFSGRRELFTGLHAEEFFDRPGYKVHPVVRLDMSDVATDEGVKALRASLLGQVQENAARLGVDVGTRASGDALSKLIKLAAQTHGSKVVVLVDEYDKPILDNMHDPKKAGRFRDVLRNFYVRIKACDAYVHFVFLTGISKFAKMGVFSALNNLVDISMDERYAAMLGYTEEELLSYFDGHIGATADRLGKSRESLVAEIRDYYDGFSFDGTTMLYNPFSTLRFFTHTAFRNYWFESGTPSFIARYMRDRKLTVEEFRGMEVSLDFASFPGEIESSTAASFLYQSGYLSLRPARYYDYSLDYPNHEVLTAMSGLLTKNLLGEKAAIGSGVFMRKYLLKGDVDGVVRQFNQLLAAIPYDDYDAAAKVAAQLEDLPMGPREWLYRSTLYSFLLGIGLDVDAEKHTSKGRSDMVVTFENRVWVIEIKVATAGEDVAKEADKAFQQIIDKGYAERYPDAVLVGVAIDDERRAIGEYRSNVQCTMYNV